MQTESQIFPISQISQIFYIAGGSNPQIRILIRLLLSSICEIGAIT